jgi:hypothetical protein
MPIFLTVPTYTQNSTGCGGLTGQQRKEFGEQHLKNANELLVFDKPPGFPTLSEKEREILHGSYHTGHEAPSPLVFSLYELLTVEEAIVCIKANAKNMVRGRLTKGKSNQYEIDATYEDAVEMHKELDLKNVKLKKIMGGDARVEDLDNGTVIVRERSTEGSPTIEIQDKTNPERIKETKFRCQSPNYLQG